MNDDQQVTIPEEVAAPVEIVCDSCGKTGELFDVAHHQEGNAHVWHYCATCQAVHDKEVAVVQDLKELAKTHPEDANLPEIAGKLHQGMPLSDVKAEIDRTKQPELEAELVEPQLVQQ